MIAWIHRRLGHTQEVYYDRMAADLNIIGSHLFRKCSCGKEWVA